LSAVGFLLAAALSVVVLLWYYRPTVEYAYVDILELRKDSGASSLLVGVAAVLTLGGLAIWWWLRRRKRNQNG
jgi:hypothetical protein